MWISRAAMAEMPIARRSRVPKRNQEARRRVWSEGWVMPKVLKNAEARASKKCMV